MRSRRRAVGIATGVVALVVGAAACSDGDDTRLTIYNAQHATLLNDLMVDFNEATGIKVDIRSGEDFELANLIVQEGESSPADVFITENSPAMTVVDDAGLFAKLDEETLSPVPASFSPADGDWMGMAARSTVLVYNTDLDPSDLPASILDLADPEWDGRIGFSPGGADFQAIVSAVVQLEGAGTAEAWLEGLEANAQVYQGNIAVMKAVNDGQIDAGIIYHYYWYRDQAESGANSDDTELHYFGNQDPGAFLSISGVGVLAGSDHPDEALELVRYLTSERGQELLAESFALEYPVATGVAAAPALKPLDELDPPEIDVSALNGPDTRELMQQAGLL